MSEQIVDMLEAVQRPQVARLQATVAALEAENRALRAVISTALDDLESRDELSALDGLRAALAGAQPDRTGA